MAHSDPIADLLTRIKNAYMAKNDEVLVSYSNIKKQIAEVLKREGYLKDFSVITNNKKKSLKLNLLYNNEKSAVIDLKRISKPGLRKYASKKAIPRVLSGLGIAIMTTSQGVMTDKEARKKGLGGEIICKIW